MISDRVKFGEVTLKKKVKNEVLELGRINHCESFERKAGREFF